MMALAMPHNATEVVVCGVSRVFACRSSPGGASWQLP